MMAALIAEPQPYPVFMCCRTLDVGAHHACWLLLQALFIIASVLTTMSTTRTMTNEVFIAVSRSCLLFVFLSSEKSVSLVGELVTARQ